MTEQDRAFWAKCDPAFLAQYDANNALIEKLRAATAELERAERKQAEADLERIYAEYEVERMLGQHDSGYRFTNHDGREG